MICAPYKDLMIPKKFSNANWEKALEWLKSDSWKDLPMGRTEIDGSKFFVLHSSATTKLLKESRYESHRLYADIQVGLKGSELVLVCPRDGLKLAEAYSAEKDVDFLEGEPVIGHTVVLSAPMAVVLFPWDVHMPGVAPYDKPCESEKIVLKICLA